MCGFIFFIRRAQKLAPRVFCQAMHCIAFGSEPSRGSKNHEVRIAYLVVFLFRSSVEPPPSEINIPALRRLRTFALANCETKTLCGFVFIIDVAGSASRPSPSCVVLFTRHSRIPKLALWATPLAKTCHRHFFASLTQQGE